MKTLFMAMAAALAFASPAAAQSQDDLLQIEIAAARRALSAGNIARNQIVVDSSFSTRAAPGTPSGRLRPVSRTAGLQDAVTVAAGYNRPYGAVLLLLSEPIVNGQGAEVVTTLLQSQASGRLTFETLTVKLEQQDGKWVAVSATRLGKG